MNLNIYFRKSVYLMLFLALGTLNSCTEDVNENPLVVTNVDASFTITPVAGAMNTYLLTAQPKGVIFSKWDLGDGAFNGKMNQVISLPDAGTYTVTHTAVGAGAAMTTSSQQIVVAQTDPAKGNLVQGGTFATAADQAKWTSAQLSPSGAAFWSFANNSATIHSPGGWAQEGIYQAIEVVKDREYTIDMNVSCPSGSDETWFEVYAGKSVPQPGVEYKDNKVMGLSTWDGCAKDKFSGRLSGIGCVKNDATGTVSNVVKFSESGKIYLLIRSGGNTFTKDGITVSKIEFRGK
ncbi:PKD domain-containing protein [Flavobacterium anhuiense]|uniref:PKD domain-containing protein n=1 Tax=Flavobacterium anhuiense TaxID=459526 RepID=UPI003D952FE5